MANPTVFELLDDAITLRDNVHNFEGRKSMK